MTWRHTEDRESEPRRRPFGWFPRLGMNLLAFFADGSGGGYPAATASCPPGYTGGGNVGDMQCCGLAVPNNECCYPTGGSKALYQCPAGYQKTWWFCMVGSKAYGCGECSTGNTCYYGPWQCSIWWEVVPC